MKHAFLIIAHNLFDQLQILLNILDDERNDIYVHIDKKISKIPSLVTSKSNLFISQKIDVRWGSRSQIEVELYLFEKAYLSNTNYSYYHLLSGVDLPIKNNDYIHSFFSQHMGYEFVGICHTNDDFFINRINRYHLFTKYYRNNNPISLVLIGVV